MTSAADRVGESGSIPLLEEEVDEVGIDSIRERACSASARAKEKRSSLMKVWDRLRRRRWS
jgi:hypothetical protein